MFAPNALKGLRQHFLVLREFKVTRLKIDIRRRIGLDARFLSQIAIAAGVLSVGHAAASPG
jgi:hypothetical protein